MKKLNLQKFTAPEGMTGNAQIDTRVREIDFVTSFSRNVQDLLDVMGIARLIRKENGSALKTKTVTGTLKSGEVAEGEEIPFSQYTVKETVLDTIKIEKYAKAVSIEAIAEKGYANAVTETDAEFQSDLQQVVLDKFYAQLKAGTLTGAEATWQMAIAMAIGKVKNKFKSMHRTATGVAVWVNILDVYKYVGASQITVQTAFGMDYLENFMGADVVFMTSEIDEGNVIATPINNVNAYYIDPSDSEFAQAGLPYTTDSTTGMIGFHINGNYNRALSEEYAIMGLRLFAEYVDAIANITVSEVAPTNVVENTQSAPAGNTVDDTVYTADELDAKTVAEIKALAEARGYTITKTVKGEIIEEFVTQQNA